jgi:hypothetical protein
MPIFVILGRNGNRSILVPSLVEMLGSHFLGICKRLQSWEGPQREAI